MQLDIPLIRQDEDSLDCGPACLAMMLSHQGMNIEYETVKDDLERYDIGTYVPQLGIYALDKGYDAKIISLNPHLFNKKSYDDILSHFKTLKAEEDKKEYVHQLDLFIDFVRRGGVIDVKLPGIDDIKEELQDGRPVGALVTTNFIQHQKPIFNFHFNVITGIDEERIYVNDPLWDERGGRKEYTHREFLYALHATAYGDYDNASLLIIKDG